MEQVRLHLYERLLHEIAGIGTIASFNERDRAVQKNVLIQRGIPTLAAAQRTTARSKTSATNTQ